MRSPPFSVIATWPQANYVNPVTRGDTLLIVETIFLSLAWIFLLLRLYVRLIILRKSWWDDWIMVFATVCTSGVTACVILATTRYGWDLHVWDIRNNELIAGRQISIAGQTIFVWAGNGAKLSILVSYLRIAGPQTKFRKAVWLTIGYVCLIHFIFLIVLWTQCVPARKYWDIFDNGRHCIAEGPPLMGQISTNIAADAIVYVLPLATLARLKLPLGQRIALMAVFGAGAIVVIAACLRLYYTYETVYKTYDVTWVGYNLWIWTAVESNLGIICGCVPALKPLVYKAKTHFTSYSNKASSASWGRSKSYASGSRSKHRSLGPEIEMANAPKSDRNGFVNIEKTVEWEVTDTERPAYHPTEPHHYSPQKETFYSASVQHKTHASNGEDSWLEDSDSMSREERGFHYGSTTEVTQESFGLKS